VKNGYFRKPFAFWCVYNEDRKIQNSETGYQNKVHPVTNHKGPEGVYSFFNLGATWSGGTKPGRSRFTPQYKNINKDM